MNQINEDLVDSQDSPSEAEEVEENPSTLLNSATTPDVPDFGWSTYAERINGRFAMVGFLMLLLIEILSHDSFLHWIGFLL